METRRWVGLTKETVLMQIRELAFEIKWIKHVETCGNCLLEIQLNVERYGGSRLPWYLDLINDVNELTEEFVFKGCPKVEDYRIGSYWTGTSDDTIRFIKDRLHWAENLIRKQIVAATGFLRIIMSWNFDWEPPLFWGVKMSELAKQMKAHGITNPWHLTEFDQWVNDATRKDIENLLAENSNVFGLKFWSWDQIPLEKLHGIYNFGVDLIFKEEDKDKVQQLIEDYKRKTKVKWSIVTAKKIVDQLFELAILDCCWV